MKELIYALLNPDAIPPKREAHSAGFDCFAFGNHTINPGDTDIVPLGFFAALEPGYVAFLWDRSSMGAKGIHRFAGVIDWSYRGQWGVILHNASKNALVINHGDKIVQAVIQKVELPELISVPMETFQRDYKSDRSGGLGSTGGVKFDPQLTQARDKLESHWKAK